MSGRESKRVGREPGRETIGREEKASLREVRAKKRKESKTWKNHILYYYDKERLNISTA